MKKNIIPIYVCMLLSIAALAISGYQFFTRPKIAFVRSEYLIYNFKGTKEAQAGYNRKLEAWQANIDTLRFELQRDIMKVQQANREASADEQLVLRQNQLAQYVTAIENKAKEQDKELMEAVFNQINSFAQQYGKEQGYSIILGSTSDGSILYGHDADDITEDVLNELNRRYEGR